MRLQHVSVMFVIIFIPIILVTSYFISLQVNTIRLESEYSDKLLKATYDAMTAFELNTANEDLSSVSDSLRSIIDASTNIFFNTLCTNLGVSNASKSFVQPYIPSILYTLYDGYYIYSPTNIPIICTDKFGRTIRTSDFGVTYYEMKNGIGFYKFEQNEIEYDTNSPTEPISGPTVNYKNLPNDLKQEYGQILYKNKDGSYSTTLHTFSGSDNKYSTEYRREYILKSYIPYSARYSDYNDAGVGTYNITINYTLDNFLSVEGMIGDIYYTKSGYLIESDLVKNIVVDGEAITDWTSKSEDDLIEMINTPEAHTVSVDLKDGITISNQDGKVSITTSERWGFKYIILG